MDMYQLLSFLTHFPLHAEEGEQHTNTHTHTHTKAYTYMDWCLLYLPIRLCRPAFYFPIYHSPIPIDTTVPLYLTANIIPTCLLPPCVCILPGSGILIVRGHLDSRDP